jgi:hypothetical protein
MGVTPKKLDDPFHRHLDECEQCRLHPFNLCAVGIPLLQLEAAELQKCAPSEWPPLDDEGFPF